MKKKIFFIAVVLFFLATNITWASSITLSPSSGESGEQIFVYGNGFLEDQAGVYWNGELIDTRWSTSDTLEFTVPDNASNGRNEVVVDIGDGQRTSPAWFLVGNVVVPPANESCPVGYKCPNNRITCNTNECVSNSGGLPTTGSGNNNTGGNNNSAGPNNSGPLGAFPGEDLSFQDVLKIVNGFVCWILNIATTVMIIFIIWSGFMFMTAGANPAKQQEAIKNFKTVLWGILVIFAAGVIISTVGTLFGWRATAFIPLVC